MVAEGCSQSSIAEKRYGEYTTDDREELAVKVAAADYNGQDFDGCPFSSLPDWLIEELKKDHLEPHTRGGTDYAQWTVKTPLGYINAALGDYIVRRKNGDLSVVDSQDAFIFINLRPPLEENHDRE